MIKRNLLDEVRDHLKSKIEQDKEFFASQARLMSKIQLELGRKRGFVFIDEIQRKENAGLFLKGIYDMNTPYKFMLYGSGSVERQNFQAGFKFRGSSSLRIMVKNERCQQQSYDLSW